MLRSSLAWHYAHMLGEAWVRDLKLAWHSRIRARLPESINLLANDICNSRCGMCMIWQQKRDHELSPDELAQALRDPLFAKVRFVGITGGEPTLRRDLPDLFATACNNLPQLEYASLITNGIRHQDIVQRTLESAKICDWHGVKMSAMVSIDGVGQVHDQSRGRPGNFDSAMAVLRDLRDSGKVSVSLGCTITKTNVWHVHDVLALAQQENVPARFRVGEFINRLYNESKIDLIRNFDQQQTQHLAMFFHQLEQTYETSQSVRQTYRSIREMLLGGPRMAGCPYQDNAVLLDCRGQLQYCAPKGEPIGAVSDESAMRLYRRNIAQRREIKRSSCTSCIHDYHAPPKPAYVLEQIKYMGWRKLLRPDWAHRISKRLPGRTSKHRPVTAQSRIMVAGWYGTETVGDKAILDAVIRHDLLVRYPQAKITVASMFPYVTRQTLGELGIEADIVPMPSRAFARECARADLIAMGGGPIMDIPDLRAIMLAFGIGRLRKARLEVIGCGVGPIRSPWGKLDIARLLEWSHRITLRDRASTELARDMTGRDDIETIGDPAVISVTDRMRRIAPHQPAEATRPTLACFVRQWSPEYRGQLNDRQFAETNARFEKQLVSQIMTLCKRFDLQPVLYPMHSFFVGGDDRAFALRLSQGPLKQLDPIVWRALPTVDSTIAAIKASTLCLCMRFHSMVFADTINQPWLAIDYTNGGKIAGYVRDHDRQSRVIRLLDLIDSPDDALARLGRANFGDELQNQPTGQTKAA